MIIDCARSPFEFAPVRDLLEAIGHDCETLPEKLALALIRPLDERVVAARRSSHLTDAASRETQLRFYSERMIQQHLRTLAVSVARAHRDLQSIEIRHCEHLREGASLFFRFLARHLPNCDVRLRYGGTRDLGDRDEVDPLERVGRDLYHRDEPLGDHEFEQLFEIAHRCSYVGDYWSSARILEKLERQRAHREVNVLLGIAANAKADPFRAEYYYLRNYRGDDVVDKIRACYSLSMLCIRHHAPAFRDVDQGERYLQEAYALLDARDPHDEDHDLAFRKVFNRNGHALVLFKRGRVREALAQLQRGIARLGELSGEAVGLHRSVLTYNAMLCHRALGDTVSERACFGELMRLDPLYPYYRLDYASSLLTHGCYEEAIEAAERARELDPFLAECHAVMGRARLGQGRLAEAEECFGRAHELDPFDPYYLCSLGRVWNELDEHQRTYDALRAEDVDAWDDASYESALCLQAESSIMVHHEADEAVTILRRGLLRRGSSEILRSNLEHIGTVQGVA